MDQSEVVKAAAGHTRAKKKDATVRDVREYSKYYIEYIYLYNTAIFYM
jgi:hypothetical protein